ncbi:MAG TPA: peptide deformylase [Verrucomicrobiota bacterium]|nr:peptide deformylase [Verrucomicrobiota bacterium]
MILEIVKYGHPTLRKKGERIETVTPEIKKLVADMFETMHANKGVGLAAQQVARPLQLTVIDVTPVTDRPSTIEINGEPRNVADFMPMVLINPELKLVGETVKSGEGCLSFPEMYAEISRPESVDVKALNEKGKPVEFRAGGLLSRAIQHEADHLNGILFIDRMSREDKEDLKPQLEELQAETKAELAERQKQNRKS